MMGLYFLVICSVGILRPIKNAVALAGLAPGAFYKVYFVSAAVALFLLPAFLLEANLALAALWTVGAAARAFDLLDLPVVNFPRAQRSSTSRRKRSSSAVKRSGSWRWTAWPPPATVTRRASGRA